MRAKTVLNENEFKTKFGFELKESPEFGFSSNLLGLEANNGKNSLYLTAEFAFQHCRPNVEGGKTLFLNDNPELRFGRGEKMPYRCDVYFRKVTTGSGSILYKTIGNSGSHGFGGGQYTQRETLAATYVKQILGQLYEYLERL